MWLAQCWLPKDALTRYQRQRLQPAPQATLVNSLQQPFGVTGSGDDSIQGIDKPLPLIYISFNE